MLGYGRHTHTSILYLLEYQILTYTPTPAAAQHSTQVTAREKKMERCCLKNNKNVEKKKNK